MQTNHCDVLIAGAGPVGLTAALELTRQGLHCRIVDRAPLPTDKSKALVLWPRTLELLNNAGIAHHFVAAGMLAKGASIYGNGKRLVQVRIDAYDSAFPRPLMLPQSETERLLNENLERLAIKVQRPVELTEFADLGDAVEATLVHGDGHAEQVRAGWLLGCDGAHSIVRKHLGLQFTGECEPNDWLLADVYLEGPVAQDELEIYWHSEGVVIFFPIGKQRFRVIADLGAAANTPKPPEPSLADMQAIVDRRGPSGVRLFNPVWLSGFRINERKVDHYSVGRIFLAGDAAHIHSPAGGQGMNTGMQDAFNLCWKLALVHRGQAAASLLDSYSAERSAVGDMVLRNATRMTHVATVHNPLLQIIRNHIISAVGKLSAFRDRIASDLTELKVHYPNSPLNADAPGSAWNHNVAPGDRLPDAELTSRAAKKQLRLYDALRGTGYNLLLLPADPSAIAPMAQQAEQLAAEFGNLLSPWWIVPDTATAESLAKPECTLIDTSRGLHERLGTRDSALVLVRPDQYIQFRGDADSWEALRNHLASFLHPQLAPTH